jgi:NADH:ubiquinone oxidoreductase subunit 6 (subunit J)
MKFPYESVPDGAIFAPHHFYIGVFLALIFCAVVWDNNRYKEPLYSVIALSGSLFAFALIWPYYSVVGALLTLICLGVATTSLSTRDLWKEYPLKWRILALLSIAIAWDDALEHAFGIPTPLDLLWKIVIHPYMM